MRKKYNIKDIECSKCKQKISKYRIMKNYPFGKKSKPVITYLCKKCRGEKI